MLYFDKTQDGCRIAIWHVTESVDELLTLLPDEDLVRDEAYARFLSEGRILEWTAVRVLLYDMLDRQVPILYHDNGAPYLPEYEHLDISISHTRGYVAVALAEQGEVGIDVEQMGAKAERVRHKFIRDDEEADTQVKLLLHWSAKETAFKILNRNNVDFLKHLRVMPFELTADEGRFLLQETKTDDEQLLNIDYKVFPDFVLTYSHITD